MRKVLTLILLISKCIYLQTYPTASCLDKKPTVSLITSLYNGDEFIAGFLSDIVRQTLFQECELIIINANSPGKEEPLIREYMKKFSNIVYIKLDHDPGLYAVWNMAIKMARADFIANANVDDRRNPESLEKQVRALEQDRSIDLVYCDYYVTLQSNETFESNTYQYVTIADEFAPSEIYKCLPGPQPLWRKNMHTRYGYFDESYISAGDFEMWNRAVSKGAHFKKIHDISGLFYLNPKGLSTDNARKKMQDEESARIVQKYQSQWIKIPHYFCTASDAYYFPMLLNLIGSIHATSFYQLGAIAVFDLGLTNEQKDYLNTIDKVTVHNIELTHADILTPFKTSPGGKMVPGWYAWKFVALKQALDLFPYVLWVDAGTTILRPLNILFEYIQQSNYFLAGIGDVINGKLDHPVRWSVTSYVRKVFSLDTPARAYVLDKEQIDGSVIGVSRRAIDYLVAPLYSFTRDLKLFEDDGTAPSGFGCGRHDQLVLSVFAYICGLTTYYQDCTQQVPIVLNINGQNKEFYMTWDGSCVTENSFLYHSRGDLKDSEHYSKAIRYK